MGAVTVFDVAKYILKQKGTITGMKLQKLAFYANAWHMVWSEEQLFTEQIEAWVNGAVVPALYEEHRGLFHVTENNISKGDANNLSAEQKENVDKVLQFYGKYTAQQLSDINHQEEPWIQARDGFRPMQICNEEITPGSIFEYYSGLAIAEKD